MVTSYLFPDIIVIRLSGRVKIWPLSKQSPHTLVLKQDLKTFIIANIIYTIIYMHIIFFINWQQTKESSVFHEVYCVHVKGYNSFHFSHKKDLKVCPLYEENFDVFILFFPSLCTTVVKKIMRFNDRDRKSHNTLRCSMCSICCMNVKNQYLQ
jgi:hypothetical protein